MSIEEEIGLECLRYVPPVDVETVWPAVLPGLRRLLAKCVRKNDGAPWTIDQLKEMTKAGTFDLLLGYRGGKYRGWTMITKLPREFTNEPILFILTGYTMDRGTKEAAFRDYDRIARHCGIKSIAFCTSFKGWRRAKPAGFKVTKVWYERQLD